MPANKRRSRHGTNNTSSSSSTPSANFFKTNSLPSSATVANGSNHINHHHLNHNNISLKQTSAVLPTVNGGRMVNDGVTGIGTIAAAFTAVTAVPSTFTLKQQQQLDRNAYLLTLTKDQLKVECRKRGQKSTGTKAELVFMPNHHIYHKILQSILTHSLNHSQF